MSEPIRGKKIALMLDNEPLMIDRRIILEAQTLIQTGYHVILATQGDGIKPHREWQREIEIVRFVDGPKSKIRRLINNWNHPELKRNIDKHFSFLPNKLSTLIFVFCHPPAMTHLCRRKLPGLKKKLGNLFEPLVYSLMLRPSLLVPYFQILKSTIITEFFSLIWNNKNAALEVFQKRIYQYVTAELHPQVVHVHDLPNLALGAQIAEHFKIPLIYDAHELYPMQFFSDNLTRQKLVEKEKFLIPKVSAIITVNQQCKDILKDTYSFTKDITVVSNATETPANFDPRKKDKLWHQQFNLAESIKIMVFPGGINPVRNVDELIYALNETPEHIHIGFITFAKDIPYYQALTSKLGVSHRVHYMLELPWDQVIYWLAAADVGIMPYQATNLNAKISSPNKLYEFITAGLPIIASTELVNVKEAIETYKLGVCEHLAKVDSYVNVINKMFDPELGGPDRFKDNVINAIPYFRWDNNTKGLIDLYESLDPDSEITKCVA